MRCLQALVVMATALSVQMPVSAAQTTHKTKPGASATPHAGAKAPATTKASTKAKLPGKANSQTASTKAHPTGGARASTSRRLVNGRWVAAARRPVRPPKPVGQQRPEPERYQDIQKALQERGYFKGEPNGEWHDDSADALKHFQADQKLPNDGKINSLTLIGLGLGAKHDGGPVIPPPTASLPPATAPPISPETLPAARKP